MSQDEGILTALVNLIEEDRNIFVPIRISILVYLYLTHHAQFTQLQQKLQLTSGNLSSHLRYLHENHLVDVFKHFVDLKPTTIISITPEGADKIRTYIQRMQHLVTSVIEQHAQIPEKD